MQVTCRRCQSVHEVDVSPAQLQAWINGALIQDAMPHLSVDDRELLISHTCGPCFDTLFPPED